jgi:hypothetical protein
VPKQRHETQLAAPMMAAFAVLLEVVARGRWGASLESPTVFPRSGLAYRQQRGKVLRRGKVRECLRPVSVTLEETLLDPPCCVKLRLHFRLEPLDAGSLLLLDVRYTLNGAATLRRRHWNERIHAHCARMIAAAESRIAAISEPQPATIASSTDRRADVKSSNMRLEICNLRSAARGTAKET